MFSVCPYVCLSANKVTLTKLQTDIDEIFCDEAIVNTCSDFIHSCNRFIPSVVQTNQNTLSILARRLLSLYFFSSGVSKTTKLATYRSRDILLRENCNPRRRLLSKDVGDRWKYGYDNAYEWVLQVGKRTVFSSRMLFCRCNCCCCRRRCCGRQNSRKVISNRSQVRTDSSIFRRECRRAADRRIFGGRGQQTVPRADG